MGGRTVPAVGLDSTEKTDRLTYSSIEEYRLLGSAVVWLL
jgi:hypothetical protein